MRIIDWTDVMKGASHHEAGHAVAAYYNGYRINRVTATEEELHCSFYHLGISIVADHWRLACITLTGVFAHMLALRGEIRPQSWQEFAEEIQETIQILEEDPSSEDVIGSDEIRLFELLHGMGCSLEEAYEEVVGDTWKYVLQRWPEIQAVAAALEAKGTLPGPEVVTIIERARQRDE